MKLLSITALLAVFSVSEAGLASTWSIDDENVATTVGDNEVVFSYPVGSGAATGSITATGFDKDCSVEKGADSGLTIPTPTLDGTTASLTVDLDPEKIAGDTALYSRTGDEGKMEFCVRFGLETSDGTEVNFVESIITLTITLAGGFSVAGVDVSPKQQQESAGAQQYSVTAFLCDSDGTNTTLANDADAFKQGSLITVCVQPDEDSKADGIVMNSVNEFTWTRDGAEYPDQAAVSGSAAAGNQLTELFCTAGDVYCYFQSILFASFYVETGTVGGDGQASMQFATATRRLGESDGRSLQDNPTSAFDVDVGVSKLDDGPGALKTAGGVATLGVSVLASALGLASAILLA